MAEKASIQKINDETRTRIVTSLGRWFARPIGRKVINIVVPGALAAILWPIVGPAVGTAAAVVAVQNGLKALGIGVSDDTAKKLVEGTDLGEDDYHSFLEQLFKNDREANKDAAKVLAATAPAIIDVLKEQEPAEQGELIARIQQSMKDQGGALAETAEEYGALLQKGGETFDHALAALQQRLTKIEQVMIAEGGGTISNSQQEVDRATAGNIGQGMHAVGEGSRIDGSSQRVSKD